MRLQHLQLLITFCSEIVMRDTLSVGDVVDIYFENCKSIFDVTIIYVPVATGDCWHVRTKFGKIIYVQNFSYMEKS